MKAKDLYTIAENIKTLTRYANMYRDSICTLFDKSRMSEDCFPPVFKLNHHNGNVLIDGKYVTPKDGYYSLEFVVPDSINVHSGFFKAVVPDEFLLNPNKDEFHKWIASEMELIDKSFRNNEMISKTLQALFLVNGLSQEFKDAFKNFMNNETNTSEAQKALSQFSIKCNSIKQFTC